MNEGAPVVSAAPVAARARTVGLLGALLSGLLFGIGLLLSGMTDPAKVQGFLDIFGAWDPSLALVMVGGITAARIGVMLIARRGATLSGLPVCLPPKRAIDARLIVGSALFGAGWGLAGYCPGPAVVSLGFGSSSALALVVGMLVGLWIVPHSRPRR
ncbi:MAG: YeeE/YedE family protein [Rhodocyclaceae bacterium]|nr:MAG: YeeE/YedE family protein [Rhodocyclaceae bacterium]